MNKIKAVTAYRTSDGQMFADQADAVKHQSVLDFEAWYHSHQVFGATQGSRIDHVTMMDWLVENSANVRAFLDKVSPV